MMLLRNLLEAVAILNPETLNLNLSQNKRCAEDPRHVGRIGDFYAHATPRPCQIAFTAPTRGTADDPTSALSRATGSAALSTLT